MHWRLAHEVGADLMPLHALQLEHKHAQSVNEQDKTPRDHTDAHVVEERAHLQRFVVGNAAENKHALFVPATHENAKPVLNLGVGWVLQAAEAAARGGRAASAFF